jgi:hypothetical protein
LLDLDTSSTQEVADELLDGDGGLLSGPTFGLRLSSSVAAEYVLQKLLHAHSLSWSLSLLGLGFLPGLDATAEELAEDVLEIYRGRLHLLLGRRFVVRIIHRFESRVYKAYFMCLAFAAAAVGLVVVALTHKHRGQIDRVVELGIKRTVGRAALGKNMSIKTSQ